MVSSLSGSVTNSCAHQLSCYSQAIRQDLTIPSALSPERQVRVFLPPSYQNAPDRSYPLLLMQDGQNLFDDHTAFAGRSWRLGSTLSNQICHEKMEESIVVGIDNSGVNRTFEYTPWKDDQHNVGGGAAEYLDWIEDALLPELNQRYRIQDDPSARIIGGSSLGALLSLYALTTRSHLFGGAMLMSGSWWWQDHSIHEFLKQNWQPQEETKVWLCTGDHEKGKQQTIDMKMTFAKLGLIDPNQIALYIAENGGHNEASWGDRVHLALRFFFGKD